MKRNALLDSASLVERFATWARLSGRERFWGVAKTGGRFCLLMKSVDASGYRVLIIAGPEGRDLNAGERMVYIVAGYPDDAEENDETTLGSISDDPGVLLTTAVKWMLVTAHDYHRLGFGFQDTCIRLAGVARFTAENLGDALSAAEAVVLAAEATAAEDFD